MYNSITEAEAISVRTNKLRNARSMIKQRSLFRDMICRNCNRDAGNASFCPYCGAPMRSKYCPRCGVPLPPDGRACYSCGWRDTAPGAERAVSQPAPEVNSGDKGLVSGKREEPRDDLPKSSLKRSGAQTLMCLISGIVVLAVMGVTIYLMLMGNMFASGGAATDPLTGAAAEGGSFGLVTHFDSIKAFIMGLMTSVPEAAQNMDLAALGMYVSSAIVMVMYALAAVIVSIATLVAVIRFIVGMARGRYFNMAKFAAVDLAAVGLIWMGARFGYLSGSVGAGSGTLICLLIAAAALAVCLVSNLVFAGRQLAKAGSVLKLITNAGIFACAAVCFLAFPFRISESYTGSGSEAFVGVLDLIISALNGSPERSVSLIGMIAAIGLFVFTLKYLFTLPFYMSKTASRLARTFKFDGYRDKGFMFRSIELIVGALPFAVLGVIYLRGASSAPSTEFVFFLIAVVATFVFAVINRLCLNRDQL